MRAHHAGSTANSDEGAGNLEHSSVASDADVDADVDDDVDADSASSASGASDHGSERNHGSELSASDYSDMMDDDSDGDGTDREFPAPRDPFVVPDASHLLSLVMDAEDNRRHADVARALSLPRQQQQQQQQQQRRRWRSCIPQRAGVGTRGLFDLW